MEDWEQYEREERVWSKKKFKNKGGRTIVRQREEKYGKLTNMGRYIGNNHVQSTRQKKII